MPTTHENDKLEIPVGKTVGGAELVIVPTKTGLYRIESRGSGAAPALTEEIFTDLRSAKRAMERYRRANATKIAKKEFIEEFTSKRKQRHAEAETLKNGELDKTIQDEE